MSVMSLGVLRRESLPCETRRHPDGIRHFVNKSTNGDLCMESGEHVVELVGDVVAALLAFHAHATRTATIGQLLLVFQTNIHPQCAATHLIRWRGRMLGSPRAAAARRARRSRLRRFCWAALSRACFSSATAAAAAHSAGTSGLAADTTTQPQKHASGLAGTTDDRHQRRRHHPLGCARTKSRGPRLGGKARRQARDASMLWHLLRGRRGCGCG